MYAYIFLLWFGYVRAYVRTQTRAYMYTYLCMTQLQVSMRVCITYIIAMYITYKTTRRIACSP
jgi:hypothetical protein